jgi:hypothetical protein
MFTGISALCEAHRPAPVSRAAFREAWKVMLFSASIVKCFIGFFLCATSAAVITFIALIRNEFKLIRQAFFQSSVASQENAM